MFWKNDLYSYHSSTPEFLIEPENNKRDKNIFGLELECNDENVWSEFSDLVHDNIVAIPYNEDEYIRKHTNIIGEEDSTAEFELVFQAERPRNLLLGLKAVNTQLKPGIVCNGNGGEDAVDDSSAHIHINNIYLDNKGIETGYIAQFAELLAPAFFTMSGRIDNGDSLYWGNSLLTKRGKCHILAHPSKRAAILSDYTPYELTKPYHGERYVMINTPTQHDTTELRIFSNTCSFDYDRIHLFLDTANFLIEVTDKYQSYDIQECYQDVIDEFKSFMTKNRRRKQEAKKLGLEFFWSDAKTYYEYIADKGYANSIRYSSTLSVLRMLRDIERTSGIIYDGNINLNDRNVEEIKAFLEDHVECYEYLLKR